MKTADLIAGAAHEARALALDEDAEGRLNRHIERLGIKPADAFMLGIGTVLAVRGGDGRWHHDAAGVRSLTLPVYHGEAHLDTIAFPAAGGRGLSLTDLVAGFYHDEDQFPRDAWNGDRGFRALSADELGRHLYGARPLRICNDVAAWARGGFDGLVILDLDAYPYLYDGREVPALSFDNELQARAFKKSRDRWLARMRPTLPTLHYRRTGKRAAVGV